MASWHAELPTLSKTAWVVAAAVVDQSHVALNQRAVAVIGRVKKHTNSQQFFFSRPRYKKGR